MLEFLTPLGLFTTVYEGLGERLYSPECVEGEFSEVGMQDGRRRLQNQEGNTVCSSDGERRKEIKCTRS